MTTLKLFNGPLNLNSHDLNRLRNEKKCMVWNWEGSIHHLNRLCKLDNLTTRFIASMQHCMILGQPACSQMHSNQTIDQTSYCIKQVRGAGQMNSKKSQPNTEFNVFFGCLHLKAIQEVFTHLAYISLSCSKAKKPWESKPSQKSKFMSGLPRYKGKKRQHEFYSLQIEVFPIRRA